tara:strand:+ start:241 stop:1179 length:939 start_codon:yes stop_codon:yes gene_type:complete
MGNRGSALLSALFIMTMVAIAATAMSARIQLEIYRTNLALNRDKLVLASQGITFWAMDALADKKNKLTVADENEVLLYYPDKPSVQIYPGVRSKGRIYDLQARFNLNNLKNNQKYNSLFLNLLNQIIPKVSSKERKSIKQATSDWISQYQPGKSQTDLANYYKQQKPPYLSSHQQMQSISEFRLVKGVSANIYRALEPYLTALPKATPININTATKPILMSLGSGLTEEEANEIIELREENDLTDKKKLLALSKKHHIPNNQVALESNYFLCVAIISVDEHFLTKYTVLERQKNKEGRIKVSIISESYNGYM